MQARYYDPVIGRFYSNDPVGFTGEVDTFNRYSYVANNPYKYADPTGEAKVYIWNAGPTADPNSNSTFGHIAIETKSGAYISKFPSKQTLLPSAANFHTKQDDLDTYGREADTVIDIELYSEDGADKFAKGLLADPTQTWSGADTCADAVETVINAGGVKTGKGDLANTPQNLKNEILEAKPIVEKNLDEIRN